MSQAYAPRATGSQRRSVRRDQRPQADGHGCAERKRDVEQQQPDDHAIRNVAVRNEKWPAALAFIPHLLSIRPPKDHVGSHRLS